jgi:HSP20 family protein
MTLTHYRPWNQLSRIHNDLSRFFDDGENLQQDWRPAVDVEENENAYLIKADVPGVNPQDIEVDIDKGVLTIKGHRETSKRDEHDGYQRIERFSGSFSRRFSLPDSVDAENIEAKSNNGVLEIAIPKKPTEQARKITVQS